MHITHPAQFFWPVFKHNASRKIIYVYYEAE